MNVEKVVYAPTNPTPIARRSVSEIPMRFPANVTNQPRNKLPLMLMTNVPTGKLVPKIAPQAEPTKNRRTAPTAPAPATERY